MTGAFQNIVVGLAAADADNEIVRYAKNLAEQVIYIARDCNVGVSVE